MRYVLTVVALAVLVGFGHAQSRVEFEVASVRAVDNSKLGNSINMNIGTVRREELTFGNATLNDCIRFAYGMASDAQIVGPEWITSKQFLYDIRRQGRAWGIARAASGHDAIVTCGAIQTCNPSSAKGDVLLRAGARKTRT